MKTVLVISALIVVAALIAQIVLSRLFLVEARRLMAQISAGQPAAPQRGIPPEISVLARKNGADGAPRAVRFTQDAEMELRPGAGFSPVPARQVMGTGAPQFVWLAEAPGWPVPRFRVVDAFVAGQGFLKVRLAGSIPFATYLGPQADLSEAMRYLAELPWAPDAILGNPALKWRQSDGWTHVALPVGNARAEVRFRLEGDDIVEMRAEGRPATTDDGGIELRAWRGLYSDYGELGARRVPRAAEVGYVIAGNYAPYWRGRLTAYEVLR